ncbi:MULTISPECIES: hypothetical protein [Prevotellaceae]|jgi:hypothetical protein|uniref:hypothetical protein n=1 Tax=Segatella salivae TaxID=228604 RepID=UPI00257E7F9A|nr:MULTISPECIES: hypothetical protein [Prevotellaceae]
MYRFVSSQRPVVLKKAYLKEYNVKELQRKLNILMTNYPEIKEVLPKNISAIKLLVGNFKYLTRVYCAFTDYLNKKETEEKTAIKKTFKDKGFNYDNHKSKIAKFLKNNTNGFEIHNCVYCDLEDITTFTKTDGTEVRKFETEHVLDKGECPLVGMSLYNFVPSCGTCNGTAIKGTKTIGATEVEMARLSPSAEGYDFENKVKFEVKILIPDIDDLKAISHTDDYEIDFNVREALYQKIIDLFELKSRYNHGTVKVELLKWRDKRRENPDNKIQENARLLERSFKDTFEELFELDLRRREHYTMEKARRDVMLI